MRHTITFTGTGNRYEIDDDTSEHVMRENCPRFFANKHGSRETFSAYRGFLIVRHTVRFSGSFGRQGEPQRLTVLYAYVLQMEGRPDLFCVSAGNTINSISQAKRLADRIISEGRYAYDMDAITTN